MILPIWLRFCLRITALSSNIKYRVKHQISGTAIVTKFTPTYACIFMNEIETIDI